MQIELTIAAALAVGLDQFIEFLKQFKFLNWLLPSVSRATAEAKAKTIPVPDGAAIDDEAVIQQSNEHIATAAADAKSSAKKQIPAIQVALGILMAVGFDVDIFGDAIGASGGTGDAGVWLTGVIIGLGATPTHQITKLLEKKKEEAKSNSG